MFLISKTIFILTLALVLFVPGYFFLRAIFGKSKSFSSLENIVLSLATSITIVDILMLFLGKLAIPFTRWTLLGAITLFVAICIAVIRYRSGNWSSLFHFGKDNLHFSRRQSIAFLILIFLTVFIKTTYLSDSVLPSSTDLGHHMYWTKLITAEHTLPVYEETDINMGTGDLETLPIADFIIGEHLPFAAVSLISEADIISTFPISVLLIVNIFSVLAIFILALSLFDKHPHGKSIALSTLLLIGPLWALASPQTKFVSGGVIGNTIGNLFIPLILYCFYRALFEKSSRLLALGIFLGIGVAYTHHLSTFVLIFISLFTAIWFVATNYRTIFYNLKQWLRLAANPYVISAITLGIILVLFVYVPTYLNTKAVSTAVGTPTKSTRIGFTFAQLSNIGGQARMALALVGLLLIAILPSRKSYSSALLIGWLGSLLIMSLKPNLLFVDIPSNRIASYIIFPLAIVGSYALVQLLSRSNQSHFERLRPFHAIAIFFFFISFAATGGLFDNAQSLAPQNNSPQILQTHAASTYLAQHSTKNDGIIKDHNYLAADAWIKTFFMRGYTYPLSRGYFKRYEDETKPREQCTLNMISNPDSPKAKECFEKTRTDFVMVNPKFDSPQFIKSKDFIPAYISDDVAIYYRTGE